MPSISAPTELGPIPAQGDWTYEDYRRLPEDGWRYEVLEGVLHMTPAPRTSHQEVLGNLVDLVRTYVKSRSLGRVYFAPTDVRLPGGLGNPVQPDLFFVAAEHLSKVKEAFVEGSPDLIAEVLSPTNWLDDRRDKYRIYAQAGVREYWIVDPDRKIVEVFVLRRGAYEVLGRFESGEIATSEVLKGFEAAVDEVFSG
jgi:Uma2 family endonuclease